MAAFKMLYFAILLFFTIELGKCERVGDSMYEVLPGAFCFRRLTATKQYGCTSSSSGDYGVVHWVSSPDDINWILKSGSAGPYVPVLPLEYFTRINMTSLRDSGKVSGILLWKNESIDSFSTDDTCPNRYSGLASEECGVADKWNTGGNSLLFEDWGFPIVFTKDSKSMESVLKCFQKYNNFDLDGQKERSLCAIRIDSFMAAAVDSQTCMRRNEMSSNLAMVRYCDPLGDYSIYMMAKPSIKNEKRSVILLTARQDSSTMFDSLVPGAMDPVTSLVTILTTSRYLSQMGAFNKTTDKNLMVVLFNGESYDYIGSSRIVYDMVKQKTFPSSAFPLSIDEIGLIVELDQITGKHLFYHSHSTSTPIVDSLVNSLHSNLENDNITLTGISAKLPPSSMQRFLMSDPNIPTVLISNYNTSYNNPFYHSVLDDATFLGYKYGNGTLPTTLLQTEISKISLALAKSLYNTLFNEIYNKPIALDVLLEIPCHEDCINSLVVCKNGKTLADVYRNLTYSDLERYFVFSIGKVSVFYLTYKVDELLHCYLDTQNCSMFQMVANSTDLKDEPAPMYVGVNINNNTITKFTGRTLAFLTGNRKVGNSSVCDNYTSPGLRYMMMNNTCIETSMDYYVADSPAFQIEGYNWTSNEYSTWTESIWRDFQLRMFVKPSVKHEILNVSVGLCVLIISFVLVYFTNSKADILFNRAERTSASGEW